ncbi:hypothetical protein O0L34_g13638 [Tuta absoluta]|nr:hypothetical protein O0L34_g13638 [Tuta absoluta]
MDAVSRIAKHILIFRASGFITPIMIKLVKRFSDSATKRLIMVNAGKSYDNKTFTFAGRDDVVCSVCCSVVKRANVNKGRDGAERVVYPSLKAEEASSPGRAAFSTSLFIDATTSPDGDLQNSFKRKQCPRARG